MKSKTLQIQDLVRAIGDDIKADKTKNAVLAISDVDGELAASLIGDSASVILMLAEAINQQPDLVDLMRAAIDAAPIVGMLYGMGKNTDVCDCPNCTARREQAVANPNVN